MLLTEKYKTLNERRIVRQTPLAQTWLSEVQGWLVK